MEHPLEKFKYCPVCGCPHFEVNNFKSKKCRDCGFTYYANPCSATAAFIVNKRDEMLVVRRAKEPAKGTLDLPGGFCDMGETVEEGMRREIKEETGLVIAPTDVKYIFSIPNIYHYSGMDIHTLDLFFTCHVGEDAVVKAEDDAAELQWLPLREVYVERFGLRSIREAVHRFLKQNR